ncbi:MAG: SpoIIE family protein phosphatase [Candidatus Methylacidiphilales bacterium]|nr:SpoIIE family protein phosphatase [Candidatus Methylacidiphilales bacterium]
MKPDFVHHEGGGCAFPARLEDVRKAVALLVRFCRTHGMSPDPLQAIELAATEAANNAAEHGAQLDPAKQISLFWEWQDETFRIRVQDPGNFQPEKTASQPEDPFSERGRGLFLMEQLVDRVQHLSVPGGHQILLEKITGPASFHQESPAEIESTLGSMTEELSISYENLSTLFRLGDALATSRDFQGFLQQSLLQLKILLDCHWVYLAELKPESAKIVTRLEVGTPPPGFPQERETRPSWLEGGVFTSHQDATVERSAALDPSDPLHAIGQCYACPVSFSETILSVLVLGRETSQPYFNAGQLHIARTFADFLGIAIALDQLQRQRSQEQRALRELEIAAQIQQQLLPKQFPSPPGYRTHGICRSARQVGGDYLDVLPVGQEGLFLLIADVMGKGVSAALLATILRTAVHARSSMAPKTEQLMAEIAAQLFQDLGHLDMFITCQCAYADLENGNVNLCSAGHGPALLVPASGEPRIIMGDGGFPLGIVDDQNYSASTVQILPGDRLLLQTDGLFEAESPSGELLGMQRLLAIADRLRDLPLPQYCERILSEIDEFCGNRAAGDDRSLLVLERLPLP